MPLPSLKKYVLIIPDGAADLETIDGKTPLEAAKIPYMDLMAKLGTSGLMKTLFQDLDKGSLVAQMGILGWDPHRYYPHGRASAEALAMGANMNNGDLAFRVNLVLRENNTLINYSANHIEDSSAKKLIQRVNSAIGSEFPDFELINSFSFRNVLIIRNIKLEPFQFICPQPHENHGTDFDFGQLVIPRNNQGHYWARKINEYLRLANEVLKCEEANALFPWNPSAPLLLPDFNQINGIVCKCAVIGNMDFLKGLALAGGMEFFQIGNGYIDTDFNAKGKLMVKLLTGEWNFILFHINAPDEAAHMGDIKKKIVALENIDTFIVKPAVEYFQKHPEHLGALSIAPDHYTNTGSFNRANGFKRQETHSIDPVPFACWNNKDIDSVQSFNEKSVLSGRNGPHPISSLDFLKIIGIRN
jgi:2,3-bisphosphoglycerate-independent phosphoglycerate mutase